MNQELQVPNIIGLGTLQEHAIGSAWETIDNVELEASRVGIMPISKPRYVCPTLTHDMLMHSANEKYTEVQLMVKAWKDYVSDRYGRLKARQLEVKNEMTEIERDTRMDISARQFGKSKKAPDYISKDSMQDVVESTPRYKELKLKLQILKQEELVIEGRLGALSGDLQIISRVVELRKQEWEENRSQSGQPRQVVRQPVQAMAYPLPPRIP